MVSRIAFTLLLALAATFNCAQAQDLSLVPKYGSVQKNTAQLAADEKFVASMDARYKSDRSKASADTSAYGWQLLRQGNAQDAMRRFNDAWLLNSKNGTALWGMAAIQSGTPGSVDALQLFSEAEPLVGDDVDFGVDQAKAIGIVGAKTRDKALLHDAFRRFGRLYARAPQHALNLQNWAITLFYVGDFAQAWQKIQLAEATPRAAEIDKGFVAALEAKMARP